MKGNILLNATEKWLRVYFESNFILSGGFEKEKGDVIISSDSLLNKWHLQFGSELKMFILSIIPQKGSEMNCMLPSQQQTKLAGEHSEPLRRQRVLNV